MSLYRHPRREIGRKSEIDEGELTLGIKLTKYDIKLLGR
jgi:hypothetical protein